MQIEKDNSNSLIIAATNYPESLDLALFRRFDDIIEYPLPNSKELKSIYSKELSNFKLASNFNYEKITKESIGLSYADVHRICEDLLKEFLVYGSKEITDLKLIEYAKHRKKPF